MFFQSHFILYHSNGRIKKDYNEVNGEIDSAVSIYDEQGNLIANYRYDDGIIIDWNQN